MKNEMALSMLDSSTLQLLRSVKKDWNSVLSRSKTYEEKIHEINEQQDGMIKRMSAFKERKSSRKSVKKLPSEKSVVAKKESVKSLSNGVNSTQNVVSSNALSVSLTDMENEEAKKDEEEELRAQFEANLQKNALQN